MKTLRFFTIAGCLLATFACGKMRSLVGGASSGATVATVDGTPITDAELTQAAKSQLQKIETEAYQIKRGALDNLVEEKLIASAAKKANLSVGEYLKTNVDDKIAAPTEQEMKALYDAHKGKDSGSYDDVKPQIINYLTQSRKTQVRQTLIAKLKKESTVKIFMEPPRVTVDVGDAPFIGPKDAKVTIVEFSDYQCPFCRRVRPTVWRLTDEYKDKVKYVFRDFPLSFHQFSHRAHEAAHCAGDQGKYFELNRKLFDSQDDLKEESLKKYAKDLQLDTKKFDECLASNKYAARVDADIDAGVNVGVSGTPAFFINGIMLSGAQPYESFKQLIESELNR